MALVLHVEFEQESDGRWIADVVDLPGVMVYGQSQTEAFRSAQALALEIIADRLKNNEDPLTGHARHAPGLPLLGIEFSPDREAALAQ
jgi:predicted RNase H-like HicB family nuclease